MSIFSIFLTYFKSNFYTEISTGVLHAQEYAVHLLGRRSAVTSIMHGLEF
jgi:hypothetical protein